MALGFTVHGTNLHYSSAVVGAFAICMYSGRAARPEIPSSSTLAWTLGDTSNWLVCEFGPVRFIIGIPPCMAAKLVDPIISSVFSVGKGIADVLRRFADPGS